MKANYLVSMGVLATVFVVGAEPFIIGSNSGLLPSRTVCGTNDMVAIAKQSEMLQQMARPTGLVQGPGFLCSGTLVGADLFLTAGHCKAECGDLSVRFNFISSDNLPGRPEVFACKEVIEKGDGNQNLDYMLLRLQGSPGVEWGWYDLSDRPLALNEQLMMIHHPNGSPLKLSLKNCLFKNETNGLLYHNCDTNPGSSGSAIVAPNFDEPALSRLVGIHTLGGCNAAETGFNAGSAIHFLSEKSEAIRNLVH